jgi:hypothetical protein
MAEEPQQLKQDIEGTRSQLSTDLDALTERLSPSNVAQRQVDKAKANVATGIAGVKDRILGSDDDDDDTGVAGSLQSSVQGAAQSGRDAVGNAPTAVKQRTKGNPLAAGLIAFGAGWLISSLIPASDKETKAVGALAEKAKTEGQPLLEEAKATASDIGGSLGAHAKEAAASVKEKAQDAAGSVQEDARGAAGTVKDHGTSAAQDVKDTAKQ